MTSVKQKENTAQSFDSLDEPEEKEKKAFFQKKNTKDKSKSMYGKKRLSFILWQGHWFWPVSHYILF